MRKSTFGCFVDARKAFDTVNRDLLWYKLHKLGLHGRILQAVISLYRNNGCLVKVNDSLTDPFPVLNGVKYHAHALCENGSKLTEETRSIEFNNNAIVYFSIKYSYKTGGNFMESENRYKLKVNTAISSEIWIVS